MPQSPPGGVLGGQFCHDLAIMLSLLEQRALAYDTAAATLAGQDDAGAAQAAEQARAEAVKTRTEAASMLETYALRCDRTLRPRAAPLPTPNGGDRASVTPLGIEIPARMAGTDGWVLTVSGAMIRPWRDDLAGQQVSSDLWMYLSDADGLIYAEPVVSEVQDGMRFTLRMTCQSVAMTSDTEFGFEATVRNFPERRYVADGAVEVTGPMVIDNGAAAWPVRVRYAFSFQRRDDRGVHFADGGVFEGQGLARRLTDVRSRMARSTQTLDHACNG